MDKQQYRTWLERYKNLQGYLKAINLLNPSEYFSLLTNIETIILTLDHNVFITEQTLKSLIASQSPEETQRILLNYKIRYKKIKYYLTYNEEKIRIENAFVAIKNSLLHMIMIVEEILKDSEIFNSINNRYYIIHMVKVLEVLCKTNLKT